MKKISWYWYRILNGDTWNFSSFKHFINNFDANDQVFLCCNFHNSLKIQQWKIQNLIGFAFFLTFTGQSIITNFFFIICHKQSQNNLLHLFVIRKKNWVIVNTWKAMQLLSQSLHTDFQGKAEKNKSPASRHTENESFSLFFFIWKSTIDPSFHEVSYFVEIDWHPKKIDIFNYFTTFQLCSSRTFISIHSSHQNWEGVWVRGSSAEQNDLTFFFDGLSILKLPSKHVYKWQTRKSSKKKERKNELTTHAHPLFIFDWIAICSGSHLHHPNELLLLNGHLPFYISGKYLRRAINTDASCAFFFHSFYEDCERMHFKRCVCVCFVCI